MPVPPESRNDAVARRAIDKISSSRSAEADRQAADHATVRLEVEGMRAKMEAAVSRRKVRMTDGGEDLQTMPPELEGMRDKMSAAVISRREAGVTTLMGHSPAAGQDRGGAGQDMNLMDTHDGRTSPDCSLGAIIGAGERVGGPTG